MLDLDNFKQYNDTYGHRQGNIALQEVATCIKDSLRPSDENIYRQDNEKQNSDESVYRPGGEEFLIIIPYCTKRDGYNIAERLRSNIAAQTDVTASIGVSHYRDQDGNIEDAIDQADVAMYKAKEAGKNRVHVYGTLPKQSMWTSIKRAIRYFFPKKYRRASERLKKVA